MRFLRNNDPARINVWRKLLPAGLLSPLPWQSDYALTTVGGSVVIDTGYLGGEGWSH